MIRTGEAELSLARRLWIYQAERFPLKKVVPLLAVFSAASVTVSAALAHRDLPGPLAYLTAFIVVLVFFWQMRAMDEIKDSETDRLYRPERAIPRGVVSLRMVVTLAALSCVPALAAVVILSLNLIWLVALVWLWLALMTMEFFIPGLLRKSPALYLISHMAIMPLIDLYLTACEWLPRTGNPPDGLWTFLWMSFCNGCVIEFGRKIWAPENERQGVETYSSSWGIEKSLLALGLAVLGAFAGLVACGIYLDAVVPVAAVGMAAVIAFLIVIWRFNGRRDSVTQRSLESVSGYWVVACYLSAAVVPYAARVAS